MGKERIWRKKCAVRQASCPDTHQHLLMLATPLHRLKKLEGMLIS